MASVAFRSKAVSLLLLNILLMMLPLLGGGVDLCLVFVLLSKNVCPFWFCNHLADERRSSCLT